MTSNDNAIVVTVSVPGNVSPTSTVSEPRDLGDLGDHGERRAQSDAKYEWPEVRVVTPTRIVDVRSYGRSRSMGRSQPGDQGTQLVRRTASGRRGRTRVWAADDGTGTPSRDQLTSSLSSSRPLTPLNDGPPPFLPLAAPVGDPDSTSVTSAPADLLSMSMQEPTAPGADSHESLMRRFHPGDTLIGRIPEQPETRESLVTRLIDVHMFIIQPVYLSHRFQEYSGEKLMVMDQYGNPLLFAVETNRSAVRRACCCCCTAHRRPHKMMLYDLEERPVALFSRRLACASCWSACCLQRVRLKDVIRTQEEDQASVRKTADSEIFFGTIRQRWRPRRAEFVCGDIRGGVVLRVRGPRRGCCGVGDRSSAFDILSMHGRARLGRVGTGWRSLQVGVFSRSDTYGVEFDPQLPSRAKMTLLAAAMLLDFLYFDV